jgi:hypothetical protein
MKKTANINGKLGDVNDVRYTLKGNIEVVFGVDGSGYSETRCESLGISGADITDARALDALKTKIIATYEQLRMKRMYKTLSAVDSSRLEDLSTIIRREAYDPRSELELAVR